MSLKDAQLPALMGLEQPCSLQKRHVASCSYEQTVNNTWGIVLCGSIRWFLSWTVLTPCDLDALQRSLQHHGFPKKQLENSKSPNQTTQRLGLKQSNRIEIFCWSYQSWCCRDAQNSSNSWSSHVHPFHCVPTIWLSQLWRRFCTAARCRERLLTKPWCRGIRWEPHCSRCSICLLQLRAPSTRLEKT